VTITACFCLTVAIERENHVNGPFSTQGVFAMRKAILLIAFITVPFIGQADDTADKAKTKSTSKSSRSDRPSWSSKPMPNFENWGYTSTDSFVEFDDATRTAYIRWRATHPVTQDELLISGTYDIEGYGEITVSATSPYKFTGWILVDPMHTDSADDEPFRPKHFFVSDKRNTDFKGDWYSCFFWKDGKFNHGFTSKRAIVQKAVPVPVPVPAAK
jgi:hypothetical protein